MEVLALIRPRKGSSSQVRGRTAKAAANKAPVSQNWEKSKCQQFLSIFHLGDCIVLWFIWEKKWFGKKILVHRSAITAIIAPPSGHCQYALRVVCMHACMYKAKQSVHQSINRLKAKCCCAMCGKYGKLRIWWFLLLLFFHGKISSVKSRIIQWRTVLHFGISKCCVIGKETARHFVSTYAYDT